MTALRPIPFQVRIEPEPEPIKNQPKMPQKLTWRDLKDTIATFTEAQLDTMVTVWGEEEPIEFLESIDVHEEDMHQTSEFIEPRSVLVDNLQADEKLEDFPLFSSAKTPYFNKWIPVYHGEKSTN